MTRPPLATGTATLAFDTGPLSAFARAGLIGVLKTLTEHDRVVAPEAVIDECRRGLHIYPHLQQVLDSEWIERVVVDGDALMAYGAIASRLVVGMRNIGEAEVIAWAKANDAEAVLDDRAARAIAEVSGVRVRGSLRFVIDAINEGHLSRDMAAGIANELQAVCRLPFDAGGFLEWADEEGLLV